MQSSQSNQYAADFFEYVAEHSNQCAADLFKYVAGYGGEYNYIAGAVVNLLTSSGAVSLTPAAGLGITLGWNYGDGLFALMLGIQQLLNEDDYRQTQNKIKGLLNVLSGTQLFLLSYNPALTAAVGLSGGAALAAPSFALAMLCDLITASIDFCQLSKEVVFEGWLEERVKEVNHIEKRMVEIEKEINKIQNKRNNGSKQEGLLEDIEILENKKNKFSKDKAELLKNITARCKVHCKGAPIVFDTALNNFSDIKNRDSIKKVLDQKRGPNLAEEKIDLEIQNDLNKRYQEDGVNLAIKACSFVGMALVAIAPFVAASACPLILIAALILTTITAFYYIAKHSEKAVNMAVQLNTSAQQFFKSSNGHPFPPQDGAYSALNHRKN